MPDRGWKADRVLTLGTVCSLVRSQFPHVDAEHVQFLGSGWEFDVYLTGDGWVFRFPRRAEYSMMFEREGQVHALVAPALAPFVRVPRVELLGRSTSEFPYVFAAHRFVPGVRADDPDAPDSPDLAHRLGQVLGTLHSVPGREASAAGVPLNSGRLIGLIDWTDASLGDPVLDFIVLAMWRGAGFVRSVLQSYTPIDANFTERLLFQARVRSLYWLHSAIEQGTDKEKHLRWVANAFDPNDLF